MRPNKRGKTLGFFRRNFPEKNRKGISEIITTLIIIGLTLVATTIIWTVINGMISERVKNSQACFGNIDKIKLDRKYTCFDSSNPLNKKVRFTIDIGNIDVDSVLVSITNGADTNPFRISGSTQQISGLTSSTDSSDVALPPKNGGRTYLYSWTGDDPVSIQVAPTIKGIQCETSDSVQGFSSC